MRSCRKIWSALTRQSAEAEIKATIGESFYRPHQNSTFQFLKIYYHFASDSQPKLHNMAPKKKVQQPQENVSLGPQVRKACE